MWKSAITLTSFLVVFAFPVLMINNELELKIAHELMYHAPTGYASDHALPFRGKKTPSASVEPFVALQLELERIANNTDLSDVSPSQEMEASEKMRSLISEPRVEQLISECKSFHSPPECDAKSRYRTFDGTCNNLKHPTWGSANAPNERLMPAVYEGEYVLRKSVSGSELPSPRNLTLGLLEDEDSENEKLSLFFSLFGQLVAHDITNAPIISINGSTPDCCGESQMNDQVCAPILLGPDDPFYSRTNRDCITFVRSAPYPQCDFGKREQMNVATSYLDGSVVYGSDNQKADTLREYDGSGKMKSQLTKKGELMPPLSKISDICPVNATQFCFDAGDERVNENTLLTALHTLFIREHNRIADNLHALNPKWTGDTIFQEARKITIAELQCILCKEFLPLLVGAENMRLYNLCDEGYDDTINPGILSEFATAAFRLHSMLAHMFSSSLPYIPLMVSFSNPLPAHMGHVDVMMKEMSFVPSQKNDRHFVPDVTNFLNKFPNENFGIDLPSINIQRGRDHGLAPYTKVAEKCSGGVNKFTNFSDLHQVMPENNVILLQQYYRNVEDIDLFVGLLMEETNTGVSGPTGNCIIATQFHKLLSGDRFFYLNSGLSNSFSSSQIQSLGTCSLARLLCENTRIPEFPQNPLLRPSEKNPLKLCDTFSPMDLLPWKEG